MISTYDGNEELRVKSEELWYAFLNKKFLLDGKQYEYIIQ